MERKDLVPLLEANLARQLQWVAAADTKAAFVFSLTAAMLGLLAAVAPDKLAEWTIASAVATSFVVVLSLATLAFLSVCAFPRTTGPRGSMVFCGGVAQRDQAAFCSDAFLLTYESYTEDLAIQCHRNAVIASEKFKWIQRALIALYLCVLPWAIAIWLLYSASGGAGATNGAA